MEDADKFDASFFKISPREAAWMDLQQRIMLELTWACLEDAGYPPSAFAKKDVGVFIGICNYTTIIKSCWIDLLGRWRDISLPERQMLLFLTVFHSFLIFKVQVCQSTLLVQVPYLRWIRRSKPYGPGSVPFLCPDGWCQFAV